MDPELDPKQKLTDVERRLARLQPSPSRIDRDRMLYETGRAVGRSQARKQDMLIAASLLAFVVGALGLMYSEERAKRVGLQMLVDQQEEARALLPAAPRVAAIDPPDPATSPAPDSYLMLTRRFNQTGSTSAPATPASSPRGSVTLEETPFTPRSLRRGDHVWSL